VKILTSRLHDYSLPNKRLERTRHERASLVSCMGELLKRSIQAFFIQL
jgi:hypothetical protein